MLKNYLRLSFRNLLKNRLFSIINIGGLAGGITIALVLFLYIDNEYCFDTFQNNKHSVYRLICNASMDGTNEKWGCSPNIAGPVFKADIPEIKEQVRLVRHNFGDPANVKFNDNVFLENNLYWTDASITAIFDLEFVKGNKTTALQKPNSIIINESTEKKYFGNASAIGKILQIDNNLKCEVTGVFKNLPSNSSLDADILGSMSSIAWMVDNLVWSNASFETYFLLRENVDYKQVEHKIGIDAKNKMNDDASWISFSLQPFLDIHLSSADIQNSYVKNTGDKNQVKTVSMLVIIILLIASINYMNLATARSQRRFKEVGICKTLGADRWELIKRFYMETFLLVFASVVLAFILLIIFLPYFNSISGTKLQIIALLNPKILLALCVSLISIILISGSYPAIYLSSFNPKNLFNPNFTGSSFTGKLRQGLVIIQFSVSVILIFSTIVFYKQLGFIQTKNLGFNPQQVLCINTIGAQNIDQLNGLTNDLKSLNYVTALSRSQTYPGREGSGRFIYKQTNKNETKNITSCRASSEIIKVLGLKLLSGKTITDKTADRDSSCQVVLNRTAVNFIGYTPEEAIGKKIQCIHQADEIVGVVEDFNFETLYQPIGAYVFHNAPTEGRPYMLIRTIGKNKSQLEKIRKIFSKNLPNAAFDYTYLDTHFKSLYTKETQTVNVTLLFSVLAVLLACLGLFGLSAFMIELRIKEIGLRKILGASVLNIVNLISRKFILLVCVAICIAMPVSWIIMQQWLNNFAFHINIEWSFYVVTICISVFTASATIAFQAIKVSITNPTKNLRTE